MEAQRYPGGLRRHHRRRARQLLDASAVQRRLGQLALLGDKASYIPSEETARHSGRRAGRLRCAGRSEGWRHRRSAALPFRSRGAAVPGRRIGCLPDRAAGGSAEKDLCRADAHAHEPDSSPATLPAARLSPGGWGRVDHRAGSGAQPDVRLQYAVLQEHGLRQRGLGLPHLQYRSRYQGRGR